MSSRAVDRTHFLAIFLISMALLAYQVVLTRLFSVVFYYHFAFMGISLAMLGLTIGAMQVFLNETRFAASRLAENWTGAALGFALSGTGCAIAFLSAPLVFPPAFMEIAMPLMMIAFAVPFTYGGVCIILLLTKSSTPIGSLYAADLIGAAIGCIGVAFLLFLLDPISIILGLGGIAALAAWLMAGLDSKVTNTSVKWIALVLLAGAELQGSLYLMDKPHLSVIWSKGELTKPSVFERWNAISLVRISAPSRVPFGWGFGQGHVPTQPILQFPIDIDHSAMTAMSRFTGDLAPLAFLSDDVTSAPYQIRSIPRAAVIGLGGGRDILTGLYFKVGHITGIELNPTIFEILTDRFSDFSGHLDRRSDVSLVQGEARSWLTSSHDTFDLIQISLIDTWAATAAGGLTLTEDKLYTVNAWRDFLGRLGPNGMLSVSRWYVPGTHPQEFYRLLSLARVALAQDGIPASDIRQHLLAFRGNGIATVEISRSRFSTEEVARARVAARAHGFEVLLDPDTAVDRIAGTIVDGRADATFYAGLPFDVTAPTDNRPFFFQTDRINTLFRDSKTELVTMQGLRVLLLLFVLTLLMVVFFIVRPLVRRADTIPARAALPYLGYFAGIGLGFMLIEISQMQRLMIFLGNPIYGLTVVLSSLLLFGGLGSLTVRAHPISRDSMLWVRPLVTCAVLICVGLATLPITEAVRTSGVTTRIFVSIGILAPAGFVMGTMFPVGMLLSHQYRNLQPWFWGINGSTSVLASVLGVLISMEAGIAAAFWSGVVCYIICFMIAMRISPRMIPAIAPA